MKSPSILVALTLSGVAGLVTTGAALPPPDSDLTTGATVRGPVSDCVEQSTRGSPRYDYRPGCARTLPSRTGAASAGWRDRSGPHSPSFTTR